MLYALLISAIYLSLLYLNETRQISPDSKRYFVMSKEPQCYPFHLRWLLPFICRQNFTIWNIFNIGSVFLIPVAMYELMVVKGYSEPQALIGCALVCGLNGVILINYIAKYLTDSFGMLMMLFSGIAFQSGYDLLGILFSGIGTMANEKTFIYTSLITFNPLALIGGLVIIPRLFVKARKDDWLGDNRLENPFKLAHQFHKNKYFNVVTVWGVCLLALNDLTLQLILTVSIAYLSVIRATDLTRLFMWSFPVVVIATVNVFPYEYTLPLLALHWFNSQRVHCI